MSRGCGKTLQLIQTVIRDAIRNKCDIITGERMKGNLEEALRLVKIDTIKVYTLKEYLDLSEESKGTNPNIIVSGPEIYKQINRDKITDGFNEVCNKKLLHTQYNPNKSHLEEILGYWVYELENAEEETDE